MKKYIISLLHIGFWACYSLLMIIMLGLLFKNNSYGKDRVDLIFKYLFSFAIIPSVISFYSYYCLIFPYYLKRKSIYKSIIYSVLISLLIGVLGVFLITLICGNSSLFNLRNDFAEGIIAISLIATIIGVIALFIKGFITWFDEIKLKEVLKQKNNEMELALIKSQLDPHFLFNTINNIDALILNEPNQASNYLNTLSDIMRFMLFETKTDKVLIAKEIEYIKKYIRLQKIRTANTSYVSFKVVGEAGNKMVAPMLFIPFIENAFKHTTNKRLKEAITITITTNEKYIELECKNKYDSSRKLQIESNGLGNKLIQKRLHLTYPEQHILKITNQNNEYCVYLKIDYEKI